VFGRTAQPGTGSRRQPHRHRLIETIGGLRQRNARTKEGRVMAVVQRIQGYCGLCIARCGTVAVLEDGHFTRLEPDPTHPTGQALCAKGRAAPELVYSPKRLTHPLRRTRPKGDPDPGWQRIGWDEALHLTASAMRRIAERDGPEAVCFSISSPSTTAIGDGLPFIRRLMNAFGTPNAVSSLELCGWGRGGATSYTFGVGCVATGGGGGAMADIANAGCLILWGYNPSYSRLTHATATIKALKRGMKLIVVDPRHVGLASKADLWLRVRPGTDGALALGVANLMIRQGWYDRDFIRTWSNGPMLVRSDTGRVLDLAWDTVADRAVPFDGDSTNYALEGEYEVDGVVCHPVFELYSRLCQKYSPEKVEEICWIPRARVEETARLIWHSRPVAYYAWSGHEQQANTTQTARAMSVLYALTGCFDAPGGNVLLPAPAANAVTGEELPAAKRMAPALGLAERPLGPARSGNVTTRELSRAILEGKPYPVRGLLGFGSNMLLAHADGARVRNALAALEFYAHSDLFMTPTAEMADVVLPVTSCFERPALKLGFEISPEAQSLIQYRQLVASPPGEARADTEIVFELAKRLGLGEQFWDGDIEAAYRHQLGPSGVTLEQLRNSPGGVRVPLETRHRKYSANGFATPSRRVEIYSQTFLEHGYAPLPDFEEPQISPVARPDIAMRFPLILTCAKPTVFCQTQHRGLPSLRMRSPDPEIDLHPIAAKARGIGNGDWVTIETPDGSARARAKFNEGIDARVVVGEHGWWQACEELGAPGYDPFSHNGANFNLLIGGSALDPVSGTASHRAYLCDVRPLR
jgi:anaerobic selenocysteine-containing dehydrogenase